MVLISRTGELGGETTESASASDILSKILFSQDTIVDEARKKETTQDKDKAPLYRGPESQQTAPDARVTIMTGSRRARQARPVDARVEKD